MTDDFDDPLPDSLIQDLNQRSDEINLPNLDLVQCFVQAVRTRRLVAVIFKRDRVEIWRDMME